MVKFGTVVLFAACLSVVVMGPLAFTQDRPKANRPQRQEAPKVERRQAVPKVETPKIEKPRLERPQTPERLNRPIEAPKGRIREARPLETDSRPALPAQKQPEGGRRAEERPSGGGAGVEANVRKVRAAELQRHREPRKEPPDKDPPPNPRRGHRWHWHPWHHRWVLLPVTIAPRTIVIPADFHLPATVEVWGGEVSAVGAGVGVGCRCPHCGRMLILSPGE